MPFSIVFHCEPEEDIDSREFKGEGLRNFAHWFLERLGPARDHGATSEEKASFTVSPFFAKRSPSQRGESGGQEHRGSTVQTIQPARLVVSDSPFCLTDSLRLRRVF